MGIDLHNLALLAHAQDLGASYGRTVGIGRQALFVDPPDLDRQRGWRGLPPLDEPAPAPGKPRYFEPLMRQWFGASTVDSVDASPYESATWLHDMNLPWPAAQPGLGSYDAVLDFGCLEHVFDFPTAWRNCVSLCKVGGHLMHSLPANNLSGHGFYQFSPELFFNLYQAKNGFALKGLWFALKADPKRWWRVADPSAVQRRVTLCNAHEVYMLVLAEKLADMGPLPPPQQSDYAEAEWLKPAPAGAAAGDGARAGPDAGSATSSSASPSSASPSAPPPSGGTARRVLSGLGLLDAARAACARWNGLAGSGVALPAPDYLPVELAALLRRDVRA